MTLLTRMRLLGGFTLEYRGETVPIASQRMQALLAYLALHRNEMHSRQHLAFLLWPDSSESQAFTNLRTLLHRLHSVFPNANDVVQIDPQAVAWTQPTALTLDVDTFEQAIRRANDAAQADDDAQALQSLEQAVNGYPGDLLPDCYDEWVLPEREQLRATLFTALERLVTLLEHQRRYATAVVQAQRLVRLDPLNEVGSLTLMRLHILNGDRASALRVYHACASMLQAELGTTPSATLTAAYEQLLAAEALPAVTSAGGEMNAAPLIGREREWKRMQAAWQVAASGQPRLLILSGEAGIGKTRLAEDLFLWANRQGIVTAVARCYPAEGDMAYAAVTALLRTESLRPGLARLKAEWLTEIARLVPDLLAARTDVRPPGPLNERWQRQRLFEALARMILALERPVLLLIDDLQWCDRDSLEWLHFLLRYEPRGRVLIVGTERIDEITDDHPLIALLDALRREGRSTEIALGPLSGGQTTELAGHIAGRELNDEQASFLYAETEGNPLFVVETLRAEMNFPEMVERTEHQHEPGNNSVGLPPTLQAVVARRLRGLSPSARSLLDVAAVIGRSFTFPVMSRAIDLDEDGVVRALDELWQRHVVREQGPDAYDFTHGKLRSVAYAELSTARLRVLHRRVAQALEGTYAADLDPVIGQIAMHYERADLATQAVGYYRRAGAYARRLYANDLAIANYRRALALVRGLDQPELAKLYDEMAVVLHFTGHYGDARESWMHALAVTPETDRLARAERYCKLGNAWRDQYLYEEALQCYDNAERALGSLSASEDDALWFCGGQIKLERMNVFYWLGQSDNMLELLSQVQDIFERRGSTLQQARFHQIAAATLLMKLRFSNAPEVIDHTRTALRMFGEAGDTATLPSAHFQLGFNMFWAIGDLDIAESEMRTALPLAQENGDISLEARCWTYLTIIARMRGQVEQVQMDAEQSLRIAEASQMHEYIGAAHGNLAWVAWRRGSLDKARNHGESALSAWARSPLRYMFEWLARWPLIAVALTENKPDEALQHGRALLNRTQKRMPSSVEAALETAEHKAEAGDHEASARFLYDAMAAARQAGYL